MFLYYLMKKINISLIQIVVFASVLALYMGRVSAANMTSTKYSIIDDSVNFGGTENSTSSSYNVSDTLGEVGSGFSSSTNYGISAGYRNMQSSFISISSITGMSLPDITGLGGENTMGSTSVTVITDNPAGYQLMINADTSPALRDPVRTSYFSDYSPSGSSPDYFFTVPSGQSEFGFSPEGPDIIPRFIDNGSACSIGAYDTQYRCWDGFSTTTKIIAEKNTPNMPAGSVTVIEYKAAVGPNKIQDSGSYRAGISITAVSL